MEYLVVIEDAENNLAAYSPDLPGCVATGKDAADVLQNMEGAIRLHLRGLRADGLPVPEPRARAERIRIS